MKTPHTYIHIIFRVQNFRLHQADPNVNQSYEVHRINRMFGRCAGTDAGGSDTKTTSINNLDRNNSKREITMDSLKPATELKTNDVGSL